MFAQSWSEANIWGLKSAVVHKSCTFTCCILTTTSRHGCICPCLTPSQTVATDIWLLLVWQMHHTRHTSHIMNMLAQAHSHQVTPEEGNTPDPSTHLTTPHTTPPHSNRRAHVSFQDMLRQQLGQQVVIPVGSDNNVLFAFLLPTTAITAETFWEKFVLLCGSGFSCYASLLLCCACQLPRLCC